jgi:hypothetical protein
VLGAIIVATQVLVYGARRPRRGDGLRIRLLHSAERQKTLARGVALLLAGTAAWALLHGWQA